MMLSHIPVLQAEVIRYLNITEDDTYVDCTLGGGGHSSAILSKMVGNSRLFSFDQDQTSIDRAKKKFGDAPITLVHANFSHLKSNLPCESIGNIGGILADIGISSMQLDNESRGFSFQNTGPLDMRMDISQPKTAATVVNQYSEETLTSIFYEYGEERWAKKIAQEIIKRREIQPFQTTTDLSDLCARVIPRKFWGKINPATRVFQALRIEVNNELDVLASLIQQAFECLKPGGRLLIISFHSLEDRIVKQAFRNFARKCICPSRAPMCTCERKPLGKLITRKPIVPSPEEITANWRARSAKLRVIEKC